MYFSSSCNQKINFFDRDGHYIKPIEPYVREEPKVGRNDACPCGSGKKYKKCCINLKTKEEK